MVVENKGKKLKIEFRTPRTPCSSFDCRYMSKVEAIVTLSIKIGDNNVKH